MSILCTEEGCCEMASGNRKRRFNCNSCGLSRRTRDPELFELGICTKCRKDSVLSHLEHKRLASTPTRMEWKILREDEFLHPLVYRQVAFNHLTCLGLGKLELAFPSKQGDKSYGRLSSKCGRNVYDLLLVNPKGAYVCLELKRGADCKDLPQFLRYLGTLERVSEERGLPPPTVVIITIQLKPDFVDAMRSLHKRGVEFPLFQLSLKEDGFYLERVVLD